MALMQVMFQDQEDMEGKTYEKKSKGTEKMKKFAELVETNAYKSSRY